MIVDVIAVHAKVESVCAPQSGTVFFQLIGTDDDVVPCLDVNAGAAVISDVAADDSRILRTILQVDPMATVVVDADTVDEDLVDVLSPDSMAGSSLGAFGFLSGRVSLNSQACDFNPPELGTAIVVKVRRPNYEGRLPFGTVIDKERARAGAFYSGV
jgi:hypothetical protein